MSQNIMDLHQTINLNNGFGMAMIRDLNLMELRVAWLRREEIEMYVSLDQQLLIKLNSWKLRDSNMT